MSRSEDLKSILERVRSGNLAPDSALHRYRAPEKSEPATQRKVTETDIAIVGVAGRYPGARDLDDFWDVLREGTDCVAEVPQERWNAEDYYSADPRSPGRTNSKWGGFLSDIDKFDAPFFSISPREAEMMDPQQRLFLQEAWTALEEAGYGGAELDKLPCGVFVGTGDRKSVV